MPTNHSENSPFLAARGRRFQFSLGSLLIAMIVFSTMSACLLWASRLPLITNEFHAWMGTVASTNKDGTDRATQLMFLIFCYSSPLLMAAALNLTVLVFRGIQQYRLQRPAANDKEWEME